MPQPATGGGGLSHAGHSVPSLSSHSSSNAHSNRIMKLVPWRQSGQPSAERIKLQKDLFNFQREIRHGFPHKPTALAWDPELRLMALGTQQGALRVLGKPGVELYGLHESEIAVTKIVFLPGRQGRVITLTEDNFLHLWEIRTSVDAKAPSTLVEVKSTNLEGRLKKVTVIVYDATAEAALLGTEGGNIYRLRCDGDRFTVDNDNIIYQDIVMKGAPDDFKVNPGPVEGLAFQPVPAETEGEDGGTAFKLDYDKLLIGYARGLIAVWDRKNETAVKTFVASQQLESVSWKLNDGNQFISAHNDGSYVIWSADADGDSQPVEPPNTPYGPYPCKAITKVAWANESNGGDSWIVFSGGMPRASYGDKSTVTVMKGEEKHVVFDLASKVIDFSLIFDKEEATRPSALMILSEEELVAIDLVNPEDKWPVFKAPYLNAIHASAITCLTQMNDVAESIYEKLAFAGGDDADKTSTNAWPVDGGELPEEPKPKRDVLVTGHEDGSVKIWRCGETALSLLTTVRTNKFFIGDELDEPREEEDEEEEDEWPPFRKIGVYDPYSDDPRLAVKKLSFCGETGRLVVGGTAGQIIVCELTASAEDVEGENKAAVNCVKTDLVTEKEGFVWKGHSPLQIRTGDVKMDKTTLFRPKCVVQISPPASINSLADSSKELNVIAAGTAHGLVIFDAVHNVVVLSKCTLNAQDIANADDNPMSRRKSLKKSLRESFRRLRKGRSQRNADKKPKTTTTADPIKRELPHTGRSDSPDARPVERQVEARGIAGAEDGLGSMVRCLHFANTYIASPQTTTPTLWAGTNSGQILIFLITASAASSEKRKTDKASALLGKEIQLKHRAPVISIEVIDGAGVPVGSALSSSNEDNASSHRVLIASEEQFKTFHLPNLKPSGKFKLTAHEGSRIRRLGFVRFNTAKGDHAENCFVCLTNQGDLSVHSLPDLKRQLQFDCVRKEDVIAVSSLVFTSRGEAFYSCSSSELQRVTVAAAFTTKAEGRIKVARKEPTPPKPEEKKIVTPGPTTPTSGAGALNETNVSEMSGDITLDSVKDHTGSRIDVRSPSMATVPEVVVQASEEQPTTEQVNGSNEG